MRNLIVKYKSIKPGVKASIAFAMCSMLQQGIQIITVPIFTRMLTTEEYGEYNLYQSWLNIFSIFCTLNLAAGVFNNGMMKYSKNKEDYISSMQGLSTSLTILFFFIVLLFHNKLIGFINLPIIVLCAIFVELIFKPAMYFWSARQRYEYKYIALVIITVIMSILNPLVGILAVKMTERRGIARILSVSGLNIIFGLGFYIYNILKSKNMFNKEYWWFALKFNLPLVPHYLSQIILAQADRVMIGDMFGNSSVAVYSVAYNIAMIMSIITTSINSSFIPWSYEKMKKGEYRDIAPLANRLIIIIAFVALVPIMFGVEAVMILGTQEYLEAVWVIPPVAISSYLIFIYSLFGNVEFFYEKSRFVMYASVSAALLNIILNYIFMRVFGYIAAGYTTLICYVELAIAHYFFMRKVTIEKIGIRSVYEESFILKCTFALILLAGLFTVSYSCPILRLILIILFFLLFYLKKNLFLNVIKEMKK